MHRYKLFFFLPSFIFYVHSLFFFRCSLFVGYVKALSKSGKLKCWGIKVLVRFISTPLGSFSCKVVWNCDRSCVSSCLCGQPWRLGRRVPAFTYLFGGLWNTDASGDYEFKRREDKSLGLTYRGTWGIKSPRVQGGVGEKRQGRKKTERSGLMNIFLKSMKLGKRSPREQEHSLTKQG